MIKRFYILLLAIVASVGMSWATTYVTITQNDFPDWDTSFTKDGVTVSAGFLDGGQGNIMAGMGDGSFSTTLGSFTKIEVNAMDVSISGEGWSGDYEHKTWTGNASSVSFSGEIMGMGQGVTLKFTIGDPLPTYTVALEAGTANANKVTLSKTSAVEGATITVTPDEEYEITAFSAKYNTTEEAPSTLNPETGAYSFTMPAYDVTIEATIVLKPVPEGDIYAGFTATAGSGGFDNEGSANLVDGKFTSAEWTKWCTNNDHRSVPTGESGDACWWIDFEASAALNLTGYILTTGNDTGNEHGRNPRNWVLKAKLNADDAWTTIATVTGDVTMKNQSFKDYKFFVDQSGSYKYFRFEVFANQGANVMQLCELRLIGTEASAPAAPAYETVMNLINAIGTVELTAECKAKIDAARTAYDALSDGDKGQVTNIATLTQAETDYAALAAAAAAPVIAQIEALPTTIKLSTYFSTYDLMVAARAAYNALSAEVQAAVTNLSKLTNLEAAFAAIGGVNEKLSKPFSVGEGQVVYFSHGNLQATYNGSNWSWAFAAHQYDYIGDASGNIIINGNGTLSGAGTVDLFGWVANSSTVLASGVAKYGVSNSTNVGDYGLGTTETLKGDWGVAANDANIGGYNDWRILSKDEWVYLFKTRTDAASKYGYATVGGVNGVIIIPDAFTDPMKNKGNLAFRPQNVDKGYSTNVYTTGGDWEAMEAAGAVFMPAAGRRYGTTMTVNEGTGFYWSSTPMSYQASYFMGFMGSNVVPDNDRYRSHGLSVRLVSNNAPVVSTPLEYALAAVALINAIPTPVTLDDACKDAIDAARAAVDALGANASLIDDADMNKLTQAETDYADLKTAADQAEADKVIAKINNIPTPVELKLATRDSIESARAAYDALTAEQQALVSNYTKLTDAEAALAALNPGGGAPAGALNGKFTINAGGDQIAFAKGNLQATTTDLGANWTWGFAANQWNYLGIAVANNKIDGNGTVSENGTVDLFGWSTAATYYGINNSFKAVDYIGDFVDWGPNMGAGWRTLTKDEWAYLLQHSSNGKATVNDKNGQIFLPDNWSGPAFTANPDNFTTNVYSGDDWTAMENAGAVFLPSGPARNGKSALIAMDAKYCSSTPLNNDTSYVFTIYYNQSQSACTGTNRAYGCMVRLVTEGGGATPLDSAQAVKDLIEAIPAEITTDDACVKSIEDARAAYDALSEAAQGALDAATVQKLTDAEAAYAILIKAEADAVVAKINNIPTPVELKLATRDSIESARAAYEALNVYQKPMVTNYQTLLDAEAALAALNPGVPPATPLDSAQAVKDLIDAIPQPVEYPTSGPAIAAALVAYNQLSDAAKGALDVADVQKMTDAAAQYAALDAIAAIDAIPAEIVYDPAVKAAIETAREKYDALIDASKAYVGADKVQKLTNAEEAWAILVAKIEHNVSYIGKDGELKHETVALLHIPDPAPEFNGYEFVRWDVKAGNFLEEGLRIKAIYTPIITTDPKAIENLVYNGTAQTLITAGVAKEGHIEYRINDGEWSAELPKATNAAAYVVYYKLVREGHADYIADPINVTIAKAPVAYTAPTAVENLVYTAENQTLIAAGQTNDGIFEYSLDPTLLDSWKAELPQAKDAGTYSVYYRVKGDLNHLDSVAATPVAVTIAKAALTATADDKNVIYGDAVPAYTVTYAGWQGDDDATVLTGDIAFACTYAPTSNVGEYTITPSGVSAANYNITFVNGKVTVAQATLTVTAENKTVTYGDAAPEFTVTYSGWKNSDDASVVSNLAYTCDYLVTSNVGNYTITPHSATALNYSFVYVNGTLTVNKAALMITAENKEVTYGDAVPEYTATYSGWKNSDGASVVSGLVYTCAYAPTSNVGEYDIVPSGATATNYAISYTNGTLTVNQAPLMITADDKSVIYGDAVPTYTATYSGWKNGDTESVVSGLAYTCEYAPTSNVGEYTITPNSATATNYAISYTNGKVTVAQATLTVTAENKTVTYGDAAPEFTVTYSGWKNTDDASVVSNLAYTCDYLVTSNVGNYTITPHSATAQNYDITFVNGTLTVNKAALMITADDKSVEYGEVAPAFTASYSGWKNTDDASVVSGLTLTSEYLVTSNVGTYDIVPANATATNYAISFTNGTLTVNQAPLMITAENKNVIYGDAVPEYTATYSGWKNDDDASVVSDLAYTCEYAPTSNVGEYTITPNSATAQNYAISYTNGKVTVAQAALTITAEDKEMIYGDEHPEFTVTYSGWKNNDDESVVSGLQFSTPYAPGSYIGTYAINPNSATALNYAITFVDGTLTVNKAVVSISGAEAEVAKFADGHANAVVLQQGTLNGIKLEDPIGHVTTASFNTADVAEHLTITLYYSLTGDAALLTNYDLQPTSEIFTTEGVIIEPFIPDDQPDEKEDQEAEIEEGIEVYAYGYCDGSGYSLRYHLESGNPDQYKIEFDDPRFTDVDWTDLEITGPDGYISIEIPVDMPTGDYTMTATFRDHRFPWLESKPFVVTFHVNLPETFIRPLFDNTIALVDTCNCFTDIQWYWRASSADLWQPIEGANGYYYHVDGQLTGEYFVSAKMNGEPTYTCGQADMETLYGEDNEQAKIVVKAFPNPVVNTTTVTIENSDAAEHTLRIVNLMGAEVLSATFEGTETKVEMGTFVQGNYMISVDGVTVKVLKK